jgi:hypothetical protein
LAVIIVLATVVILAMVSNAKVDFRESEKEKEGDREGRYLFVVCRY